MDEQRESAAEVRTPQQLASALAQHARCLHDLTREAWQREAAGEPPRPLHELAAQLQPRAGVDPQAFADGYAQALTHGLLIRRLDRRDDDHGRLQPLITAALASPLLRPPIAVIEALLDRLPLTELLTDPDPAIHFYQEFLDAYDPAQRASRGVYSTPDAVVRHLVQAVDAMVIRDFDLPLGLADASSWAELAARRGRSPRTWIPAEVDPDAAVIRIVDPATGTGTFLLHVVAHIRATLVARWRSAGQDAAAIAQAWADYVAGRGPWTGRGLRDRLIGVEVMLAPFLVSHLRLPEATLILGNTLDGAARAAAAGATVILGNPPYSIQSANLDPRHRELVDRYKYVDGERLSPRGALQFEKNLQDDYVKFFRWAERTLAAAPLGLLAYVSSNNYLDAASFAGMRQSLLETFAAATIVDLHGHYQRTRADDENLFAIRQGVALSLYSRGPERAGEPPLRRADLRGPRRAKLAALAGAAPLPFVHLRPRAPDYAFIGVDEALAREYRGHPSLAELFGQYSAGVITARDRFAIGFDRQTLRARLEQFCDQALSDDEALRRLGIPTKKGWDPGKARRALRGVDPDQVIRPITYKPFDHRYILYHGAAVWGRAHPTMQHLRGQNPALACSRQLRDQQGPWQHAWLCAGLGDSTLVSNRSKELTSFFPLWLDPDGDDRRANLRGQLLIDAPTEAVFDYVVATLFSTRYRRRYRSLLARDFPRIPRPSPARFAALHPLGARVRQLILGPGADALDRQLPRQLPRQQERSGEIAPGHPKRRGQQILLGPEHVLDGVPEPVWGYGVGAYRPLHKWLKDRRGRSLNADEHRQLRRMVAVITAVIEAAAAIDRVFESEFD